MRICNRLLAILVTGALLAPSPGLLHARTRQGDKFLTQGLEAEQQNDWVKAYEFYKQALDEDPNDVNYRIAFLRARFQAAQQYVEGGEKLREESKFEEAIAELEKALAIDPGSTIARQEMDRTREMIELAKKPDKTRMEQLQHEGLTALEAARRTAEEKFQAVQDIPELRPLSPTPITLKINNQPPKVVFETIGKLAGINVLFDPEFATQGQVRSVSLDLTNATLEQALDYAALMTKSFWKSVSANAVFVTTDAQNKRQEYEDQVARVFYLTNATTPQELTEVLSAVRTITNVQRIMPLNSQNAIVVRGTPDQIALTELLIHDLDRPRAEVVVDVIVMEVSRVRSRDLAAGLAQGLNIPVTFTPSGTVTSGGDGNGTDGGSTSSAIKLSRLGKLSTNDWSVTLPGAVLQATMSDSGTKVLQSPQVRTLDSQKASLKIGERVPYSTGGFQPAFGQVGTGFNSLYSSFQFLDVGVNVDLTPKIHSSDDVSLHIELDISNVRGRVEIGGVSQPIVGQRKVVHDIRLKEGEVSLLGGLLQNQERKTVSGVPGLSSIPILGRLFTSETVERDENELLIAIIPHIVRNQEFTSVNFKGIAMGTERAVRLSYAPRAAEAPTTPPPAKPLPVPETPTVAPAPAPEEPKPEPTPTGPPRASLVPATVESQAGATVTVILQAENMTDLYNAPVRVKFDQNILRLNEITRGDLLARDGQQVLFTRNILNDLGEASVNLTRMPGASGVNGSGELITMTFQAIKPGSGAISMVQLNLQNSKLETIFSGSPRTSVNIK